MLYNKYVMLNEVKIETVLWKKILHKIIKIQTDDNPKYIEELSEILGVDKNISIKIKRQEKLYIKCYGFCETCENVGKCYEKNKIKLTYNFLDKHLFVDFFRNSFDDGLRFGNFGEPNMRRRRINRSRTYYLKNNNMKKAFILIKYFILKKQKGE